MLFIENPDKKDLRWRIEHCQVIHPDDLLRFKQFGVIASIRSVFATSDGPWVKKRLGEARAQERGCMYQTLFQSGAVVVNGTDSPVEDMNPIDNLYAKRLKFIEIFPSHVACFPEDISIIIKESKYYKSSQPGNAFI